MLLTSPRLRQSIHKLKKISITTPIRLRNLLFLCMVFIFATFMHAPIQESLVSHWGRSFQGVLQILGWIEVSTDIQFSLIPTLLLLLTLLLWFLMLFITFVSFFYLKWTVPKFTSLRIQERMLYLGTNQQTLHIQISYRHLYFFPGVRASHCFVFKNEDTKDQVLSTAFSYSPPQQARYIFRGEEEQQVSNLTRGFYQVVGMDWMVEDGLGLFRFKFRIPLSERIHVHPPTYDLLPVHYPLSITEEVDEVSDTRVIENEPFDIRKYEPGDEIRRIHWKLYAKKAELMIRKEEKDSPQLSDLLVIGCYYIPPTVDRGYTYANEFLDYYTGITQEFLTQARKTQTELYFTHDGRTSKPLLHDVSSISEELVRVQWHSEVSSIAAIQKVLQHVKSESVRIQNVLILSHGFMENELTALAQSALQSEISWYVYYVPIQSFLKKYAYPWLGPKNGGNGDTWRKWLLMGHESSEQTRQLLSLNKISHCLTYRISPNLYQQFIENEQHFIAQVEIQGIPFQTLV